MMITWKHADTDFSYPWTLDTKIVVFNERTLGWQIQIAELIANGGTHLNGTVVARIPDSGFAVLQICLSYFETIGKYVAGYARPRGMSPDYFKEGVKVVFPHLGACGLDPTLDKLYEGARCGLYHGSMTCLGIAVSGNAADAIIHDAVSGNLTLNPHKLPAALNAHLSEYVRKLKDPSQVLLRTNFEKRFDMEYPFAVPIAAAPSGQTPVSGGISLLQGPLPPAPATTPGISQVQHSGVPPCPPNP